jgi:hypothetical protein
VWGRKTLHVLDFAITAEGMPAGIKHLAEAVAGWLGRPVTIGDLAVAALLLAVAAAFLPEIKKAFATAGTRILARHVANPVSAKLTETIHCTAVATNSTSPQPFCQIDHRSSSKSSKLIIKFQVSAGVYNQGVVLFTIFRDHAKLAQPQKRHLFSVHVPNPEMVVPASYALVDGPQTTRNVRYSLAFCSDSALRMVLVNKGGSGDARGATRLEVEEVEDD